MKQLIFIYGFFFLDSLIKNTWRIYELAVGYELEYQQANDIWNASIMVAGVMVYPAFLIIQKYRIVPFDFYDRMIIVVCTLFALIDAMDWFWNFNMRTDGMDWLVFAFLNSCILFIKYIDRPKKIKT